MQQTIYEVPGPFSHEEEVTGLGRKMQIKKQEPLGSNTDIKSKQDLQWS